MPFRAEKQARGKQRAWPQACLNLLFSPSKVLIPRTRRGHRSTRGRLHILSARSEMTACQVYGFPRMKYYLLECRCFHVHR